MQAHGYGLMVPFSADHTWKPADVTHTQALAARLTCPPPCLHNTHRPAQVSGINVVILVQRFTARWVLSAIFPIMATTWLGFLVFFLPRDDMGGRLGEEGHSLQAACTFTSASVVYL
jgi:hypothetical protein